MKIICAKGKAVLFHLPAFEKVGKEEKIEWK
ncbi:hypothetical protein ACOMICROBIO_NCLOACGD_05230 [Vibrio sp. B1ASS3]|nr:hypothetical protein ACOMICROBIO_NCLOACGD_05230 [Vibrio sp. B1ASS3]CAE6963276.1 hypothetical protein ACOMICROBIO_NCLOACGD_05230 [Vibrio sp. B1ASS3]